MAYNIASAASVYAESAKAACTQGQPDADGTENIPKCVRGFLEVVKAAFGAVVGAVLSLVR